MQLTPEAVAAAINVERRVRNEAPVTDLSAGCVVRWMGTEWTAVEVTVGASRVVVRYAEMALPVRYAIDETIEVIR